MFTYLERKGGGGGGVGGELELEKFILQGL